MSDKDALPLARFLLQARNNELASIHNLEELFDHLCDVEQLFRELIEILHHPGEWPTPLFVNRAHGAYLAACRLALSGQVTEVQPLLRSVLENALYANYIHADYLGKMAASQSSRTGRGCEIGLGELWSRRDESSTMARRFRNAFKIGEAKRALSLVDQGVGERVSSQYDRTITHGAHPNPLGFYAALEVDEKPGGVEVSSKVLFEDSVALRFAIVETALAGLNALEVFRLVFPRFEIASLSEKLNRLKREHDAVRHAQRGDLAALRST